LANEKPTSSGVTADSGAGQRLGGGRADFVASLGRKIADLRGVLATLEAEPTSAMARDDLRRKLHALGTGAKMLHFEGMAQSILDTESVLERASEEGVVRPPDLERVARALDELPTLAWGAERPKDLPPAKLPVEPPSTPKLPIAAVSVLVIGPEDLADMLVEDEGQEHASFECERVDDLKKARSVALAVAPDVVVLDGDLEGAADLAHKLLDDPLTDTLQVIVVLTQGPTDATTRFTALGVTKLMPRPLLAGALRAACQEAVDQRDGKTIQMTLGEPTVAQLGERLALEVRRALVDSVDPHSRTMKVHLGDGAEVWGALWGAIARVREVVTTSTGGMVHFTGHGPEGALALAPVLARPGGVAPSDRAAEVGRNRDDAMDVNLAGRRVIVADDDPGVTWFISDLLRSAGCVVHEALDGKTALRMAYELSPELVVSDILMPGLDGFALCRALRRDVSLRDTPVILLSWKEDLLQRVRELGASAAAYLRKESDARAIVARVREVMRPRARIAARLHGEGEVRGRLDGLTVRTLLELVIAARPAARVSIRDASFLYEVELLGGGIYRASRTSGDGTFLRGDHVIAAMLGVGAGRFVVSSTKGGTGEQRTVPLAKQFARPIAQARAALQATTGARMMTVAKVSFDDDDLRSYLLATPEPARDLVRRLAAGASPREILLQGEVSPALVEDVLADLATRGAIVGVYGPDGSDELRAEAFDPSAILPDADGTHGALLAAAKDAPAEATPGPVVPTPTAPAPAAAEPTDPVAPVASISAEPPEAGTTTASAPPAGAQETSIPVTVEPTADLRLRRAEADPVAAPARPRPPRATAEEEPSGFPRFVVIGLAALAVVAAGQGVRTWLAQRSPEPADTTVLAPAPDAKGVSYDALPAGVSVPTGQGLLSIAVADNVPVRVDGSEAHQPRQGRSLRIPLPPGVHLVSVGVGDRSRQRIVEVRIGRATNVNLDEP